jgi:hypothetical protein
MTNEQAGAVIVLVDAMLQENRTRITDLAARHRLPAVYGLSEYAEVGGLLAYGPDRLGMFRHAVTYVDKILKGAEAGRSAHRAAPEVRAHRQPQDGQGPRLDDVAIAPAAGGSGD